VYDLKHPGTYLPSKRETPAGRFLAEVRAHDLNVAFGITVQNWMRILKTVVSS
jgi:hypothetical protein